MEKVIILGGKEYRYEVNFDLSYDFLKYRNRISNGFDFSKADKKVVSEIVSMREKYQKKLDKANAEGRDLTEKEVEFLNNLSPEALEFMANNSKTNMDLFSKEEIKEIVSRFTGEPEEKVNEILNQEVEKNGFDNLVSKLINGISEVFSSAKAN